MQSEGKRCSLFSVKAFVVFSVFILLTIPSIVLAGGNAVNGEKVVKTRKIGNCIACHYVPGLEFPGDIGPNLVDAMKGFTPKDRDTVRQWVWDARKFNPDTIMPPFGPKKILTKQQVDDVVAYLYTLKKYKK
ncbi:cytochrome c [bacterium BMS3Bbin06]|nr:cytochrome c [bacterium BMS3Abin08]GBE35615.1 cytochrome c [bacterium BMS3Bbin06]HDO36329.1 sulfur oxidation c-type cytochrome SoxX [Nitrospirota bacterium]HDY70791.1 sulfur oxidation c-type cytochrome SoxX [Nitrospirota bacterium]